MKKPSTAIVQDTRQKRKDDKFPIKLRITHNRKQKYSSLGIYLTEEEWEKIQTTNPRNEQLKGLKIFFNKVEQKALDIINEMEYYSFEEFKRVFNRESNSENEVIDLFDKRIEELTNEERIKTAAGVSTSKRTLEKFLAKNNRKKLSFSEITVDFLNKFEKWMENNGKEETTIGIYMRDLRTIFNIAIAEGIISEKYYPFGNRKYQIPAGRNVKKAVSKMDIKKIIEYQPESPEEEKARDLWLFSYMCNGANFKDIIRLKYKDIGVETILFIREKTKLTTKQNSKPIVVPKLDEVDMIIDKWGTKPALPDNYVFGFISEKDDAKSKLRKAEQAIKTNNKYTKRIGEKLNLPLKLTSMPARHSFATVLMQSGAHTEMIRESLGHKSVQTTLNYLGSFEDSEKARMQKQLLNFDEEKS